VTTPNPIVTAAVPSLVAVLQAVQTFVSNLGADPTQIALKLPGALQILIGSVELQLPALGTAEFVTLQADANTKIAAWIASLQKAA
jgi:hypothetical protein